MIVYESPGSCWETIIDDLEYQGSWCEAFRGFSNEILMVLGSPGSCFKSKVSCREAANSLF